MEVCTLSVGPLPTNCYILFDRAQKLAAVIDPGFEEDRILAALSDTGCRCPYVLLTHGHFDHRTAAGPVLRATGARLVAHRDEAPLLRSPSDSLHNYFGSYVGRAFEPLKADVSVQDGSSLAFGQQTITFLHTPGHTPGGCCIRAEDLLFCGDTLFREGVGRTDFPGGDMPQILSSIKRLCALEADCAVFPGHGPQTTLAHERAHNPYLPAI